MGLIWHDFWCVAQQLWYSEIKPGQHVAVKSFYQEKACLCHFGLAMASHIVMHAFCGFLICLKTNRVHTTLWSLLSILQLHLKTSDNYIPINTHFCIGVPPDPVVLGSGTMRLIEHR